MAFNSWEGLIEHWSAQVQKAFLQAVQHIKDEVVIADLIRMLERDDYEGALRTVGLDPASFRAFNRALEEAYEAGGNATALSVPTQFVDRGYRVKVQFNVRNPIAEIWLRDYSATLATELLEGQRRMIRLHLRAGMAAGQNPRQVALSLAGRVSSTGKRSGGVLGLTDSQAEWVRRYTDELASDPAAVFSRKLRDKRFDPAVRRAIANKEPIPAYLREKMVMAYQNRALRYRAETLARTEAMVALHQSQEAAFGIAVETGAVTADRVSYVWRTARDNRVRDSHRTMNGQQSVAGSYFITGQGNQLRYPGDPDGAPEETINCRCWREPKIDFLRGIR